MKTQIIERAKKIVGEITEIASDKSISHRCVIFSLLTHSSSRIKNFLEAKDTLCSLHIAQQLGLRVQKNEDELIFYPPEENILEPSDILDCGNAGTAMRLYMGMLSGIKGYFVLSGDSYLRKRPMNRVIEPLRDIGAMISSRNGGFAPISIIGKNLKGFKYESKIPSAQVKSAMILAGLNAQSESEFREPYLSRDHTEKMLQGMGASIISKEKSIFISPLKSKLDPLDLQIPSDPSSAFFFALAAAILPESQILIKNVLLNPTRIEAFEVLRKMGAKVEYELLEDTYEKIGHIFVAHAPLKSIEINEKIAWLIDEIPALSIAMAVAEGKSVVRQAKELRVKECDRIKAIVHNLTAMGIQIQEFEDGFSILGGELKRGTIESFGDHRIAMSFSIAALMCGAEIRNFSCVDVSFPSFLKVLENHLVRN